MRRTIVTPPSKEKTKKKPTKTKPSKKRKRVHVNGHGVLDERGLNPRQQKFVTEYLKSGNGTQSAVKAGYSQKTAYQIGNRLLKNVRVRAAIQSKTAQRLKKDDIDASKVIEELGHIAFGPTDPQMARPSDKLGALNTLAKFLGLLNDKLEIDQRSTVQVNVTVNEADLIDAKKAVLESFRVKPNRLLIEHRKDEPLQ